MSIIYAQHRDPNADLKYYLMQFAQMMGQRRREGKEQTQMTDLAKSLMPSPQMPTINDMGINTSSGAAALERGWLGGEQVRTGVRPQGPPLTQAQMLQKVLQSGLPVDKAMQIAKAMPQSQGTERGTLPWYLWPEYKDSPAAQRARGEKARVSRPFGPSSTFQMKDDIDKRIEIIKSGPQKGPGAGKLGGPDYAQSDILDNYIQEAEATGYCSLSAAQQRQFDALWDTKMRRKKDFEWDPKSEEVKATRNALRTGNLPERIAKPTPKKAVITPDTVRPTKELLGTKPASLEEFKEIIAGIEDEDEARTYYDKWIHLWQ